MAWGRPKPATSGELGLRGMAQREHNALESFIEYAQAHGGLTREQAERALAVYRQAKAIKIDRIVGQFRFTHGGFGDRGVLRRAAGLPEHERNAGRGLGLRAHRSGKCVETHPRSALESPGDWPRYEVHAPPGYVFAGLDAHSALCQTAADRDEWLDAPVEPCPDPECDCAEWSVGS